MRLQISVGRGNDSGGSWDFGRKRAVARHEDDGPLNAAGIIDEAIEDKRTAGMLNLMGPIANK